MANSGNHFADAAANFGNGNWKAGVTQAAVGAVNALDSAVMGDKNFGAQSQAIDGAVHAASSALMQSGNPYAMIAGAALEGANFLTKAGGQTVQGFDVDINSSGYG
jgi:N-methylhydantoinase B/oxoprolinase/acetone carboxylase alpha subunit